MRLPPVGNNAALLQAGFEVFMNVRRSEIRSLMNTFKRGTRLLVVSCVTTALFPLVSYSQSSDESVDVNNLRAQLESSRAQVQTQPGAESVGAKQHLDQQEEALMKKLQGLTSSDASTEAPVAPAEVVKKEDAAPRIQEVGKLAPSESLIPNDFGTDDSQALQETTFESPVERPARRIQPQDEQIISAEAIKAKELEKSNGNLKKKMADLQRRLDEKARELDETRNRLVIAETQVERLSGIVEQQNKNKLAGYLGNNSAPQPSSNARYAAQTNQAAPRVNPVSSSRPSEESLVGIVTAQKAFLRSGPSKDDSPIMSVSKGTRLVVETRNDEWYRVITPTGGRAWIATQMLNFGPGAEPGSDSALRIGGYEKRVQ